MKLTLAHLSVIAQRADISALPMHEYFALEGRKTRHNNRHMYFTRDRRRGAAMTSLSLADITEEGVRIYVTPKSRGSIMVPWSDIPDGAGCGSGGQYQLYLCVILDLIDRRLKVHTNASR